MLPSFFKLLNHKNENFRNSLFTNHFLFLTKILLKYNNRQFSNQIN